MIEKRVGIGQIEVEHGGIVLAAYGVGSCVVVMLHDSHNRIGGLAHCLLPHDDKGSLKAPQGAIPAVVEKMVGMGAQKEHLRAKIVGGAKMFEEFESQAIGYRNVIQAKKELAIHGIQIVAEDVFGSWGRSIAFDTASGKVTVKSFRHGERIL